MARSVSSDVSPRKPQSDNLLLATLDAATRDAIGRDLERVHLAIRTSVYESNKPFDFVYFPINCVLSMLAHVTATSVTVEVATVGNEGMVGLPLFLGAQVTPGRSFSQIAGDAYRMRADAFLELVKEPNELTRVLHRYVQAMIVQVMQGTACNRAHSTEQRCARWLLQTHDRVDGDEFELTQEFLGQMLGESRATVNAIATKLQASGLIRYVHGRVTIVDREGLKSLSCNCYAIVRSEYDRLLGRAQTDKD